MCPTNLSCDQGSGVCVPPGMGGMGGMGGMMPPVGGMGGMTPPMGGTGGMMPPMGGRMGSGGMGGMAGMAGSGGMGGMAGMAGAGGVGGTMQTGCSPNPCKNAGTCTEGAGTFTCTCKAAWGGTTCETLYYGDPANKNDARMAESDASCREETLLDLTDWLPDPNTAHADPTLSVTCSASLMSVTSNSVPPYKFGANYANTLVPTTTTYQIPRTPVFNAVPKQATVVGGVGVAINGVQISSPSASGGPLQYADPADIEADGDGCKGHPNPQGKYHYHSMKPSCFFAKAENGDSAGQACTAPSPIIGWIADGYPILGPCECLDAACTQVVEMRSSWELGGGDNNPRACAHQDYRYVGDTTGEESDGDRYLDECNGHYGPNGDYHYHMTNAYPWTLRCYRGTPMTTMAIGHVYNNAAGTNDCCFEKQCKNGVYQTGVSCMMMSCVP